MVGINMQGFNSEAALKLLSEFLCFSSNSFRGNEKWNYPRCLHVWSSACIPEKSAVDHSRAEQKTYPFMTWTEVLKIYMQNLVLIFTIAIIMYEIPDLHPFALVETVVQ